ncbi:MAG: 7TM diverse intracellular signaling domain-containing protein [Oligoflexus sp.]
MRIILYSLISCLNLISTTELMAETESLFSWYCHPKNPDQIFPSSIPDSSFKELEHAINLNYQTDKTCWIKVSIENRSALVQRYYLEHRYPLTTELSLFHRDQLLEKTGFALNFADRKLAFSNPSFQLDLNPGKHEFTLRIESQDIMRLDFTLWNEQDFIDYMQKYYAINGGFIALCFGLALYNFMQFSVTRRPSYGFYVLFLVNYALTHMFMTGLLKQFIFPGTGYWNLHIGFYFVQALSASAQFFVYYYLRLANTLPKFSKMVFLSFIPLAIALIFNMSGIYPRTGFWNMVSLGLGAVLIITLGVKLVLMKNRVGYFFMAAWGVLLTGLFVYLGNLIGLLPSHILIENAYVIGASLEMILLSFALADQVKQIQMKVVKEKEHAFGQLKKMVYPHQLEQMKRGVSLEETMPCKGDEAAVICFDIVNSSKIKHPQAKEFFSRVFDRCHIIMERNYRFRPLTAQGFRLKEMGDGFLCSIGFPFHCPENREPASLAVKLAEEFLQIFDEEAKNLAYKETLQASVGIALGYVEGFFTISGTRHYELFGKGIILATRYESLRKSLDLLKDGHLIAIQNQVFERLTSNQKKHFIAHHITEDNFSIRDDPEAKVFYFRPISPQKQQPKAA